MNPAERRVALNLPEHIAPGIHADFAAIWNTPDTFVLDFCSLVQPSDLAEDQETGQSFEQVQAQVVARVKIPAAQVWEVARALTQHLTKWEVATGRVKPDPDDGLPEIE
jgi:hypothetical protein